MSDTDYINDHMGGFGDDGLPNFLSYGSGKGGMDGYGDVDYAFYHSDIRGLNSILYAICMTLEAVKYLPYTINDKTDFVEIKNNPECQNSELVGIADGWQEIYDIFREAESNFPEDYFIFIHPKKEILEVTFIGKECPNNKPSTVELYRKPDFVSDEKKWHFGLVSALETFNEILELRQHYNFSVSRLKKDQFDTYLAHKIAIRDIHLELEYLNKTDDESDIRDKLIKDKLVALVIERARISRHTYAPAKVDGIKILVEISTKDNLMPTFKIKPSDGVTFHLYEVSPKGDIISLHWMRNETLKEKYSLVDGAYSVPLLDLIKSKKYGSHVL